MLKRYKDMVDEWLVSAVTTIERMDENLHKLREQVIKALMVHIDAGDKEGIELLARLKGGK